MNQAQIGRYEIKSEIGRGGMATVFHAYDPRFKRDVAIKVLPAEFLHDPTFRARFDREAQIIASLEHPAIVPVYDYGEENGQPYLVMRFMTGGTLSDRLKKGPLSLSEAAQILSRLAPALDEAHNRGIVHRDLKPANILFDSNDEAYLTDFGIARLTAATTSLTGSAILGTPAYMSPEQARGDPDIDGRSDIYSLGAILFEMLTGKQPYQSTTPMGVVLKHLTEPVPNLRDFYPDLPVESQAIISRAMAKDRQQRFSTAREMASAQEALARGQPNLRTPVQDKQNSTVGQTRQLKPVASSGRKIPIWLWVAGGIVALAVFCGALALLVAGGALLTGSPSMTTEAPASIPSTVGTTESLVTPAPQLSSTFEDDFSDPSSGWEPGSHVSSRTGYDAGGYRFFIDQADTMDWATPGLDFTDVRLEVAADKIAGADDNLFGVLCRYVDENNFYLLGISSDGYYNIGKYQQGKYRVIGQEEGQGFNQAIHQGKTRNHMRAECIGTTLTLYVNDTNVASVNDADFSSGDIGLAAAALDIPGTDILFDNFSAQIP